MPDKGQHSNGGTVQRLPRGSECQCMAAGCGLFFTGESAFNKHWTKTGHVHPSEVGLVEKMRAAGPIWGRPGTWDRSATIADGIDQEGPNPAKDGGTAA